MKYFVFLVFVLVTLNAQVIENTTNKEMQCEVNYNAEFKMETIHGIEQRVQITKAKRYTKILKPHTKLRRKGKGKIICYNEDLRIISYNENALTTIEGASLERFKKRHKLFDILAYANEDKTYVEKELGFHLSCQKYKDGEYCRVSDGVDIYLNKKGRIKELFLYGNIFRNYVQNTPFSKNALDELRVDGELLAPWIRKKNQKLLARKPSFESMNLIMWKKPSKEIAYVIFTPREGHLSINRYRNKKKQKLQDFMQAVEISYILDDKAYAQKQKLQAKSRSSVAHTSTKRVPYKAGTTWGKALNPKGVVPKNKFKAFYINTNRPKEVVSTEEVDAIVIRYVWDQFHKIKSQDFGAYWVGNIYFKKDEERAISVSLSWSKARIIIDGMVVYDGGSNKEFTYHFTKGWHKIEVEYVNNWHTVDFSVGIEPKVKKYKKAELAKLFAKPQYKDAQLLYVTVYESKDKEGKLVLLPKKINRPVILVLNSYDAVNWVLPSNPHKNIKAIVYTSLHPGSKVSGAGTKGIVQYAVEGRLSGYAMKKKCICVNGGALFNCSGAYGSDVIANLERTFGKKVFGFNSKYATAALRIPSKLLDAKTKAQFAQNKADVIKAKKECEAKTNPSFEDMLK